MFIQSKTFFQNNNTKNICTFFVAIFEFYQNLNLLDLSKDFKYLVQLSKITGPVCSVNCTKTNFT